MLKIIIIQIGHVKIYMYIIYIGLGAQDATRR